MSLMFHQGAKIPGEHPLLDGEGSTLRVAKLAGLEQVEARRAELEAIIRAWCDYRDS
jgi:hypothetical protein